MHQGKRPPGLWLAAVVAVVFGGMTIKSGGTVLFGDDGARAAAGNYVGFVLWFNFLAGFGYIVAGLALLKRMEWAPALSVAIALLTLLVFAAFGVHVLTGGAFEPRTVVAMTIRTLLWIAIAGYALSLARQRSPSLI